MALTNGACASRVNAVESRAVTAVVRHALIDEDQILVGVNPPPNDSYRAWLDGQRSSIEDLRHGLTTESSIAYERPKTSFKPCSVRVSGARATVDGTKEFTWYIRPLDDGAGDPEYTAGEDAIRAHLTRHGTSWVLDRVERRTHDPGWC